MGWSILRRYLCVKGAYLSMVMNGFSVILWNEGKGYYFRPRSDEELWKFRSRQRNILRRKGRRDFWFAGTERCRQIHHIGDYRNITREDQRQGQRRRTGPRQGAG